MVDQDFVNKFKFVLDDLEKKRGPVILFALFRMDDITDKWTIILSADWVNFQDYGKIFLDLRNIAFKFLDKKEQAQIARSGIFTADNHLVKMILEKYDGDGHEIKDERFNGNYIHQGYIIHANRLLADKISSNQDQEKLL